MIVRVLLPATQPVGFWLQTRSKMHFQLLGTQVVATLTSNVASNTGRVDWDIPSFAPTGLYWVAMVSSTHHVSVEAPVASVCFVLAVNKSLDRTSTHMLVGEEGGTATDVYATSFNYYQMPADDVARALRQTTTCGRVLSLSLSLSLFARVRRLMFLLGTSPPKKPTQHLSLSSALATATQNAQAKCSATEQTGASNATSASPGLMPLTASAQ